jgi:hypothetical protein
MPRNRPPLGSHFTMKPRLPMHGPVVSAPMGSDSGKRRSTPSRTRPFVSARGQRGTSRRADSAVWPNDRNRRESGRTYAQTGPSRPRLPSSAGRILSLHTPSPAALTPTLVGQSRLAVTSAKLPRVALPQDGDKGRRRRGGSELADEVVGHPIVAIRETHGGHDLRSASSGEAGAPLMKYHSPKIARAAGVRRQP